MLKKSVDYFLVKSTDINGKFIVDRLKDGEAKNVHVHEGIFIKFP